MLGKSSTKLCLPCSMEHRAKTLPALAMRIPLWARPSRRLAYKPSPRLSTYDSLVFLFLSPKCWVRKLILDNTANWAMPSYSSLFWFYISAIYIPVIISWYLGVSPQRLLIYFRYLLPATQCRFILRYPLLHLLKRHSFLFLFSIEILNAFLREAFSDDSILLGTPLCVLCESNELTWSLLTVGGYNHINMRWLQKKV